MDNNWRSKTKVHLIAQTMHLVLNGFFFVNKCHRMILFKNDDLLLIKGKNIF